MKTAIPYIESVEIFSDSDGDLVETVLIAEAIRAIFMAAVDALTEVREVIEKEGDEPITIINHFINKYKKKI